MTPAWVPIATALGGLVVGAAGAFAALVDSRSKRRKADDEASDRLIELIEREAEKKIVIVKLEFQAKMAEQDADHLKQMNSVRDSFERQMDILRAELEEYRCDDAPDCPRRRRKASSRKIKPGGTD